MSEDFSILMLYRDSPVLSLLHKSLQKSYKTCRLSHVDEAISHLS